MTALKPEPGLAASKKKRKGASLPARPQDPARKTEELGDLLTAADAEGEGEEGGGRRP